MDLEIGFKNNPLGASELESDFGLLLDAVILIQNNQSQAPENDMQFHAAAFDAARQRAAEALRMQPELLELYRTTGKWALELTAAQVTQEAASAAQLLDYVRHGLLDSLTISELESRIATLERRLTVISTKDVVTKLFGDVIDSPVKADATAPVIQKKDSNAKSGSQQPVETKLTGVIDELLSKLELSHAMTTFMKAAWNSEVSLLRLRKNDPTFAGMDETEYKAFKASLKAERQQIIDQATKSGLSLSWKQAGNTRARTYRLVQTDTGQEEASDTQIIQPKEKTTEAYEQFDEDLRRIVTYIIQRNPGGIEKQREISERVAEWLDVNSIHADSLIGSLAKKGMIEQVGYSNGSAIIQLRPQPIEPIIHRERKSSLKRESVKKSSRDKTSFDYEDVQLAHRLCERVASLGRYDRGLSTDNLSEEIGIDERQTRLLISRLSKAGICKLERIQGQPGTQRKPEARYMMRFPSHGAWQRFVKNADDYLSILPRRR